MAVQHRPRPVVERRRLDQLAMKICRHVYGGGSDGQRCICESTGAAIACEAMRGAAWDAAVELDRGDILQGEEWPDGC